MKKIRNFPGIVLLLLPFTVALLISCNGTIVKSESPLQPVSAKRCIPGSPDECVTISDSVTIDGDTVKLFSSWDPETRTYLNYISVDDWIEFGKSFKHVYNEQLKDSIVYWLTNINDDGSVEFSGWGEYQYDDNGTLIYIGNYNAFDSLLYGYFKYDSNGKLIEYKEDDLITQYDNQERVVKEFYEERADTTFYYYSSDANEIEIRFMENDVIRRKILKGLFDDGAVEIEKYFDTTGTLVDEVHTDSIGRRFRTILYNEEGSIEKISTYTYWSKKSFLTKQLISISGTGEHLLTWMYNEQGDIIQQKMGSEEIQSCSEPFSWNSCRID